MAQVNDTFPGPVISGEVGDTLLVTIANRLSANSFSMHWHGLAQFGLPWHDGVADLTECGISPLTQFTYNVSLYHVGTYFYHSHAGFIRNEGAYGALIVRQPGEATELGYDDELQPLLLPAVPAVGAS